MRILVTNDDGIHAEGLAVLERIAGALSDDVWVCAPEFEQSGACRARSPCPSPFACARSTSAVSPSAGTPTDCVMLATHNLMGEASARIWCFSGVNRGLNAAEDVTMSGTVAGAIEAMALGVPAVALSQRMAYGPRGKPPRFEAAEAFGAGLVARLVELGWPREVILNINFPAKSAEEVKAVEVTRQGFRDVLTRYAEQRTDLRGRDYYWFGVSRRRPPTAGGTDLRAADEGPHLGHAVAHRPHPQADGAFARWSRGRAAAPS